jgi:hypothetical protein
MAGLFEYDLAATDLSIHELGDTLIRTINVDIPFTKMVKKGKTQTNVIAQWPAHFPKAQTDIARKEGEDKTDGFGKNVPETLYSLVQLNRSEGWMLTDKAKRTNVSYAKTEAERIAGQKLSDSEAFLLARERVFLSAQQPALASVAADGKDRTTGMFSWLNPTQPAGVFGVPAKCRLTADQWYTAAIAALTETGFRNMMRATSKRIKTNNKKWLGLVGVDLGNVLNSFASNTTINAALQVNRDQKVRSYENIVTAFMFPEGSVDIMTHYNLACDPLTGADTEYTHRSGAFIDPDMWRLAPFQPVEDKEGIDLGAGPRGWWESAEVLQCLQPMTQFAVYANA